MLLACGIVLAGHWLDLYVMIFPPLFPTAMIGIVDLALPFGFVGLFLLVFVRSLRSRPVDPGEGSVSGREHVAGESLGDLVRNTKIRTLCPTLDP